VLQGEREAARRSRGVERRAQAVERLRAPRVDVQQGDVLAPPERVDRSVMFS
jgi:hypothetical protein